MTADGIWSEEAGDPSSPLVVVIHGSMDRSTGMLKLSRAIDRECRVLRYDRRGYGRSAPHPGPFGMAGQVDDLRRLLAGRPAVLVGHSYGGDVALALAAHHPELVRGVAVFETPLSWLPWWPGNTVGAAAAASADDPGAAAERFMRGMIGDERWDALPERTRATRRVEGVAMVGELLDLQSNAPWQPEEIRVPVITSYGSSGSKHHQRGMTYAAEVIPGAELVVLDDVRHDAPLSHPALFAERIVRPLLARVTST